MPRSTIPSRAQVVMLIENLEERRWLATGHPRTSHARDRTKAAWQEVAVKLNSDGSGCIKSWKQWSKYWKDKKSAIRKKASQIQMARERTCGGELEEGILSSIEERIVVIMGGDSFVTGDRELEIDLHSIQDVTEEANATSESESILLDVKPGPSWHKGILMENQPNTEQTARSPPDHLTVRPAVPHTSNASLSPRKRRTVRRHLIQRSPPSQRQSQMASLTERFVALEEKRLENERLLIDNQQRMLEIFKDISEAWSRQTQALQDLCASMRRGS